MPGTKYPRWLINDELKVYVSDRVP
jgi:hypothetical protein